MLSGDVPGVDDRVDSLPEDVLEIDGEDGDEVVEDFIGFLATDASCLPFFFLSFFA